MTKLEKLKEILGEKGLAIYEQAAKEALTREGRGITTIKPVSHSAKRTILAKAKSLNIYYKQNEKGEIAIIFKTLDAVDIFYAEAFYNEALFVG